MSNPLCAFTFLLKTHKEDRSNTTGLQDYLIFRPKFHGTRWIILLSAHKEIEKYGLGLWVNTGPINFLTAFVAHEIGHAVIFVFLNKKKCGPKSR